MIAAANTARKNIIQHKLCWEGQSDSIIMSEGTRAISLWRDREGAEQLQSETFTLTKGSWEVLPLAAAVGFYFQWLRHWGVRGWVLNDSRGEEKETWWLMNSLLLQEGKHRETVILGTQAWRLLTQPRCPHLLAQDTILQSSVALMAQVSCMSK